MILNVLSFICVFNFSKQCFVVFSVFLLLGKTSLFKFTSKYFILFECYCK